jgi:UDP-2,4-diacetamido-2,4,6-trideoxy-beta-L-altropyranose hydrolase
MVAVRSAESSDWALLLDWANDPVTRRSSFHPEPIDAATHRRWLDDRLADPDRHTYIGLDGERAIGVVRLDRIDDGWQEVGITVAPDARGQGYSRELLAAGLVAARREVGTIPGIVARIRPANAPSIALFEGAGFVRRSLGICAGAPCVRYELGGDALRER